MHTGIIQQSKKHWEEPKNLILEQKYVRNWAGKNTSAKTDILVKFSVKQSPESVL